MRRLIAIGTLVLAGCGGGEGAPPAELDAQRAESLYNEAVVAALERAAGVAVNETGDRATLAGSISIDGATVSFTNLVLEKKPFSPAGSATIAQDGVSAEIAFTGSLEGTVVIAGVSSVAHAEFPMVDSFCEAAASWAIRRAMNFGGGSSFTAGITVTDNGNGTFTIDGTETAGGATLDFDAVTIDVANMTITGKITLDDGQGNVAEIVFNGTTADILINGQLVATVDLSQIFGP